MLTVVSPDLQRLAAGAKVFPKPLRASMRKELTAIGRIGQRASKAKIQSMPSGGGTPYGGAPGLRSSISTAIRVSATANTGSGVSVRIRVAQTGALEAHRRYRVAQLLDTKGTFAHKVYGRWSNPKQITPGFKYFEKTLEELAPEMRAAAATSIRLATLASIPNVR